MKLLLATLIACFLITCYFGSAQSSSLSLGGQNNLDESDHEDEILFNVTLSWNNYNKAENNYFKIINVASIQKQVVSGLLYTIDATISETECSKKTTQNTQKSPITQSTLKSCALKAKGKRFSCVFKYWVRSWMDSYELDDSKCTKV